MPKIVVDPKGRYSWEANFNPVLEMSHNAVASVKFKMDIERARYQNTLKRLNGDEKTELRVTQREMDAVRQELRALKAYKKVAQLTAFEKFDPVLRRRAEEQEKREKAKAAEAMVVEEVSKQKQHEENMKDIGSYDSLRLLSRKLQGSQLDEADEQALIEQQQRRMSMSSNVFVTLQDIMENDSVLMRHSQEIIDLKRKSQLSSLAGGDANDQNNSRISTWLKNTTSQTQRRPSRSGSIPSLSDIVPKLSKQRTDSVPSLHLSLGLSMDKSRAANDDGSLKPLNTWRRKSRVGSIGNLVEEVIHEGVAPSINITTPQSEVDTSSEQDASNTKSLQNTVFITSVEDFDSENNDDYQYIPAITKPTLSSVVRKSMEDKLVSNFRLRKLYEEQAHKQRALIQQEMKKLEQQENLRRLSAISTFVNVSRKNSLQSICEEDHQNSNQNSTAVAEAPKDNNNTSESISDPFQTKDPESQNGDDSEKPAVPLLRGLARFKNIAKTVAIQNQVAKGKGADRFKNLAAAVIIQNSAEKGKMPTSFVLNQLGHTPRGGRKKDIPALEASHRKASDIRMKPLEMPESVRREHEKKWEELMGSVDGAVQWKVRALREETGTLQPRQVRRQRNKNPREREKHIALPGACKTTWALKKYVKEEVQGVLSSWKPENMRKHQNRKLIEKSRLPEFIDRVKTTSTILKHFRSYKNGKKNKIEVISGGNGSSCGSDHDDDDDSEEDEYKNRMTSSIALEASASSPHIHR